MQYEEIFKKRKKKKTPANFTPRCLLLLAPSSVANQVQDLH